MHTICIQSLMGMMARFPTHSTCIDGLDVEYDIPLEDSGLTKGSYLLKSSPGVAAQNTVVTAQNIVESTVALQRTSQCNQSIAERVFLHVMIAPK